MEMKDSARASALAVGEHTGSLGELKQYDLTYIASPYSYYPTGLDRAYSDICEICWWFNVAGISHFSPIIYSHPLAAVWGVDRMNARFWLDFDTRMMGAADALIVVELDGWEDSAGVAEEIAYFEAAGKPVYHLDPLTLELRLESR